MEETSHSVVVHPPPPKPPLGHSTPFLLQMPFNGFSRPKTDEDYKHENLSLKSQPSAKALQILGLSSEALQRSKALSVLGISEQDLEVGERFFKVRRRATVFADRISLQKGSVRKATWLLGYTPCIRSKAFKVLGLTDSDIDDEISKRLSSLGTPRAAPVICRRYSCPELGSEYNSNPIFTCVK